MYPGTSKMYPGTQVGNLQNGTSRHCIRITSFTRELPLRRRNKIFRRLNMRLLALLTLLVCIAPVPLLLGQADQGTVTGVVQDPTGAVISNANVTLTSVDTGLVLKATADNGGVYVFSPVKIGNYKV